ncbi:MAG: hypothetical protein AAGU14_04445 [Eubacteriaceae bacterium]
MDAMKIYKQYERGKDYLERFEYYTKAEEAYRYYNGDQWNGLKVAGEKPPALNILAPIVDYKVATVAQNGMSINYSTMNFDEMYTVAMQVCEKLNSHALKTWERLKLDQLVWRYIQEAAVTGDSFVYFYEKNGLVQLCGVDSTNVFFADEQEQNLQEQKYIIIAQRMFVSDIKEEAKANGIDEADIGMIMPDSEQQWQIGDKAKEEIEQDDEDGKCLCLLKMWKSGGYVHFCRSTKNVIYQKDTVIDGLTLYPAAHFRWRDEKGSARGIGEVYHRIPNQIEINKTLARNLASIKQTAYPHVVYNKEKITQDAVKRLSTVGSTIAVGDKTTDNVANIIGYMEPAQINPVAISIVQELMVATRELAGAGEALTGNINPEQASGAAIIAVRDASALPLNNQTAAFKQFVEDIARIWYDMWVAYNPNGLEIVTQAKDDVTGASSQPSSQLIPAPLLQELKIEVRIDVSPSNPFSKFAKEQALQNLLQMQLINFEDYVDALDDDSAAPKAKLKQITQKQKLRSDAQMQAKQMINNQQKMQLNAQVQSQEADQMGKASEMIQQLMGERAMYMGDEKTDESKGAKKKAKETTEV